MSRKPIVVFVVMYVVGAVFAMAPSLASELLFDSVGTEYSLSTELTDAPKVKLDMRVIHKIGTGELSAEEAVKIILEQTAKQLANQDK